MNDLAESLKLLRESIARNKEPIVDGIRGRPEPALAGVTANTIDGWLYKLDRAIEKATTTERSAAT